MNWIWSNKTADNSFVEFRTEFVSSGEKTILRIGSDYRYVAYLNGRFVSNGQYADVPAHKSIDSVDLTPFLKSGENAFEVLCWHVGEDFSTSHTMTPALAFEIESNGKILAASGEDTLCRDSAGYRAGDLVTPQIGYGYHYDFTTEAEAWQKSTLVHTNFVEEPRPIQKLKIAEPFISEIAAQGLFSWRDRENATAADKLQDAWLASLRFAEMTGEVRIQRSRLDSPLTFRKPVSDGDGIFVIADMGKETVGHLTFSVSVEKPCDMYIGWGEHLSDLRVRTKRANRNFASRFRLKTGENRFDDYLRRSGCRYICLFVEADEITVERLSIRETDYPFAHPEKDFGDRLLNAIYETGRRTLELCAHEHYEDCPWREQALYGMDSRNQMLFGYGAFHEYEYPRASLKLFAQSMGEDGLVSLCAPARTSITIPSFTAYWIIAIAENAAADYDEAFVRAILPVAENALNVFLKNMDGNIVKQFAEPRYWNFHEWSDGLDGGMIFRTEAIEPKGDCNLTALVSIAAKGLAFLKEKTGDKKAAKELAEKARQIASGLEAFYDPETKLYASYLDGDKKEGFHAYTQALALLTGAVPAVRRAALCEALKHPAGKVVDLTFAALELKYDALIEYGNDLEFCIQEIIDVFGKMLFSGATSYPETAYGEADFEDAGSLCHGWSAVPCYVFDRYLKNRRK